MRLQDVGTVVLGAEDYESELPSRARRAVFIAINVAPEANMLTVMQAIRAIFPEIQSQLPTGMHGEIGYDATGVHQLRHPRRGEDPDRKRCSSSRS